MFPEEHANLIGVGEHEPDGPIELTPDRVACPRHAEPFRRNWPTGFTTFGLKLLEELVNDEAFMEIVGGDMAKLMAYLDERPLCERVSRVVLQRIYIESAIGVEDTCAFCHQEALGTTYSMQVPGRRRPRQVRHICFRCVVFNMTPIN